jgi:hypothetical protein
VDRRRRRLAHARHPHQCVRLGRQQRPDAAELPQQRFRQRLGITAGNGEREQIFDQLMIQQRVRPLFDQPAAQAGAVAGGIGGGRSLRP